MAARIVLIVVALVACAWFALGIRQAHDLSAAEAIAGAANAPGRVQLAHARALLDAAATLNPDSAVDITRGQLDVEVGDFTAARRILDGVVAREPENVQAWLALASADFGEPSLPRVVARITALDPGDVKGH